jgi:hypothetical protein
MKFNTLFIFLTILVIASFVVALPPADRKLKHLDLDKELQALKDSNDELKGYSVDELKKMVQGNATENEIGTDEIGTESLRDFIIKQVLKHAIKIVGELTVSKCRTIRCENPLCAPIGFVCAIAPHFECCIPGCPFKLPKVGGVC